MIQFIIMSFLFGFSGNKLFSKDKSAYKSVKIGFITAIFCIILYGLLKKGV